MGWVTCWVGLTYKKWVESRVNLFLLQVKKFGLVSNIFQVRLANFACFAMSTIIRCYYIFTISLSLVVVGFGMIFYYFILTYKKQTLPKIPKIL